MIRVYVSFTLLKNRRFDSLTLTNILCEGVNCCLKILFIYFLLSSHLPNQGKLDMKLGGCGTEKGRQL